MSDLKVYIHLSTRDSYGDCLEPVGVYATLEGARKAVEEAYCESNRVPSKYVVWDSDEIYVLKARDCWHDSNCEYDEVVKCFEVQP